MPKRRPLPSREEILAYRDEHFPKGASDNVLAEATWTPMLHDLGKHHLAWAGWVQYIARCVSSKDSQGLPISIPINETDAGGRIKAPRQYANYQQCFDYYEELIKGLEHDVDAAMLWRGYMNERFGQAPPPVAVIR
jgi:hypothetical protein